MKVWVFLAGLSLASPAFAQPADKKVERKKAAAKKPAEAKQDWGRFQSQAKKDEKQRAAQKKAK